MIDSVLRQQMKSEAIGRMKSIRLYSYIIEDFETEDNIQVYEPPQGAAYWLEEEEESVVKSIEKDQDILIWGVIRSFMKYNNDSIVIDNMLFVTSNQDNWQQERDELVNGNPLVYTVMEGDISTLEMGHISIYMSEGGTPLRKGEPFIPEPIKPEKRINTCPVEYQHQEKDEEDLKLAISLVGYYINHGVLGIKDICNKLSDDLKMRVLRYLKSAYVLCKFDPNTKKDIFDSMDSEDAVNDFTPEFYLLQLQIKEWLEDNYPLVASYLAEGYNAICTGLCGEDWEDHMKEIILQDHPEWHVWTKLNWRLFFERLLEAHIEPDNQHYLSLNEWMLIKNFDKIQTYRIY